MVAFLAGCGALRTADTATPLSTSGATVEMLWGLPSDNVVAAIAAGTGLLVALSGPEKDSVVLLHSGGMAVPSGWTTHAPVAVAQGSRGMVWLSGLPAVAYGTSRPTGLLYGGPRIGVAAASTGYSVDALSSVVPAGPGCFAFVQATGASASSLAVACDHGSGWTTTTGMPLDGIPAVIGYDPERARFLELVALEGGTTLRAADLWHVTTVPLLSLPDAGPWLAVESSEDGVYAVLTRRTDSGNTILILLAQGAQTAEPIGRVESLGVAIAPPTIAAGAVPHTRQGTAGIEVCVFDLASKETVCIQPGAGTHHSPIINRDRDGQPQVFFFTAHAGHTSVNRWLLGPVGARAQPALVAPAALRHP